MLGPGSARSHERSVRDDDHWGARGGFRSPPTLEIRNGRFLDVTVTLYEAACCADLG